MTIKARNRAIGAGTFVAIVALVATVLSTGASTNLDKTREVNLVIRDLAFYLDGAGEPNPTLTFRRGEKVRLVLKSEDAGMEHDFVVKDWKIATKAIHGRGEEIATFKLPKRAGTATYFCTPHAGKMRGAIVVE
jgi:plastocyanin